MPSFMSFSSNDYVAAHNSLVLKAESAVDKNEWINKLQKVIQARGGQVGNISMRQSFSEGSLVSHHGQLLRLIFYLSYFPSLRSMLDIFTSLMHYHLSLTNFQLYITKVSMCLKH